jgi:hypothetical protein
MKMDPFIRRLVERMLDPARPLSRNRHFHTFASPEGRRALRIARRLLALDRDLAACSGAEALLIEQGDGEVRVEVRLERLRSAHRARLTTQEFELLRGLPGTRQALSRLESLRPDSLAPLRSLRPG